jgi:phosphoribosylanthranilate isomerase
VSVFVKICGITNQADALAAVEAGADALGFMFHPASPRHVAAAVVGEIVRQLPPHVLTVGVFVNPAVEEARQIAAACGLGGIQLHGDEPPELCAQLAPLKVWKAFRIRNADSLQPLPRYAVDAWLLDAYSTKALGGTGECFNWDLALRAKDLGRPVVLAGGLTPVNIAEAVRQVRPWGVDVSSGVEVAPGQKDHAKVRAFTVAAKAVAQSR